ncbi:MAG: hypothetical protein HOO95_10620 [Gallionella sp.]|nr:hypothetical protein [Gallionella sp.]
MIETLTLITLCMLYLIYFRPGKTPTLKNPLVIERVGRYHMTLASQLNLAQPFVEAIAARLGTASDAKAADHPTQLFEVRDKWVTSHGFDRYLLAITCKSGMLYFYAAPPFTQQKEKQVDDVYEYLHEQMHSFPLLRSVDIKQDDCWVETVAKVAIEQGINTSPLQF